MGPAAANSPTACELAPGFTWPTRNPAKSFPGAARHDAIRRQTFGQTAVMPAKEKAPLGAVLWVAFIRNLIHS